MNKPSKGISDFWLTEEAELYKEFTEQIIPTNKLGISFGHAFGLQYCLDNNLPLNWLDFGSYEGASTTRAYDFIKFYLNNLAPAKIKTKINLTGVDCVPKYVALAKKNNNNNRVSFKFIAEDKPIRLNKKQSKFSVCLMYFVDQVIEDNAVLEYNFKKIYDVLDDKGIIIIHRLAEESFSNEYDFVFYGHNKHLSPHCRFIGKGEDFLNELRLPKLNNGSPIRVQDALYLKKLTFIDHFRTRNFLSSIILNSGFSNIKSYPMIKDLKDGFAAKLMHETFKQISNTYPELKKSDEYNNVALQEILVIQK